MMRNEIIKTIYGAFDRGSKKRIDLTYDCENAEIQIFKKVTGLISADVVVDVGANIGIYSIYCSDVPSVRKIFPIEASRNTFIELKKNISIQNSNSKFEYYCVAASSTERELEFLEFRELAGHNAIAETTFVDPNLSTSIVKIKARPLDDIIIDREVRFSMKIDVEGHEWDVIMGSMNFLSKNTGFIQIEIVIKDNISRLINELERLGYRFIINVKNDFYFLRSDLFEYYNDILFIISGEIHKSLTDLMNFRKRRRSVLRILRDNNDDISNNIRKIMRFKRDPVIAE